MIFTLPPLPYAMDALAPVMSRETIEYHYGKHLQTYIDNLNRLIDGTEYEDATLEEIVMNAVGPVYNNAAQAWNHTFFFNSLTPESAEIPASLKNALERDFGSVETFKEKFQKAATDLFGSGWAWLAQDKEGKLHIMQEPNAGNPLKSGHKPLLTIDVWEHAYYIDYRNKRAAFAEKFWEIVNWDKVSERMESECVCSEIENLVQKSEMSDEATAEEDKDDEASADMGRYVCVTCGYVYEPEEGDPENGVAPGTPFSEIPQEWVCPACGVGKEYFEKEL